jgi:hypothetical protein
LFRAATSISTSNSQPPAAAKSSILAAVRNKADKGKEADTGGDKGGGRGRVRGDAAQ